MSSTVTQDVFDLVLARPVRATVGDDPALVHLWWHAPQQGDRLVQVYVDDVLHDVSLDASQRELWLMLDRATSHRIALLAVPADEVWRSQLEQLATWRTPVADVAEVVLLRDESLAVATRIEVQVDGEVVDEAPLWPAEAHRSGFGALFGEGGFGLDAATGPGLGQGELGMGPLGADGSAWRWRRDDLPAGLHTITLLGRDVDGQVVTAPLTQDITIDPLPEPPANLELTPDFILRWSEP